MTTYPNLQNDPELLRVKTKDDEIKDLKYKTEKHDYENILNSPKIDNEIFEKYIRVQIKRKYLRLSQKF